MDDSVFVNHESNVRSYCRSFPAIFVKAEGHILVDQMGRQYIDLLSGAGTLNYGHNNPTIIRPICDYLESHGIVHSLDLYTAAKAEFISAFQEHILCRRGLRYKMQFPGPTGTNAVEAALKLARKCTGRSSIVAFTNAFHGMSLGSLAATANPAKRAGAGVPMGHVTFMPYDGHLGSSGFDTIDYLESMLLRAGSGLDVPAAILVETIQGEGGLQVASPSWLCRLQSLCRELGALLIVDDIQAGCGRSGAFFSFEGTGIEPDIVCLSKSLSGSGLPMSLVLLRPEIDVWGPGEHNGTFRGNNLGFVGATAAIEAYWSNGAFEQVIHRRAAMMRDELESIARALPAGAVRVKGRGMMIGLEFTPPGLASSISEDLFRDGIIAETCGAHDQVLKLLPPLTIPDEELRHVMSLIYDAAQRRATSEHRLLVDAG
jgi:diaminobutyrate-2-oxoglutarate transaminase